MSILNAHHPLIPPPSKFQTSLLTEGGEKLGEEVALGIRERKERENRGMKGKGRRANEKEKKEERRQKVWKVLAMAALV